MRIVHDPPAGEPPQPRRLLKQHIQDFAKSGLTAADAQAAGIYTESDPGRLGKLLGWNGPAADLGPAWVAPYLDPDGSPTGYVGVKPDHPRRAANGKPRKYENPKGKPVRVYLPRGTIDKLADQGAVLIVTEGIKKALKAVKDGFACVALPGVDCWSTKRKKGKAGKPVGKRRLLPDFDALGLAGRVVVVVFDSDAATNPKVMRAERALVQCLKAAGAKARVVRLPAGPNGEKVGLDDYLVAHPAADLHRLLNAVEAAPAQEPDEQGSGKVADVLAAIGLAHDLWHDNSKKAYATVGRRSYPVGSKAYEWLLKNTYRVQTGGRVPNGEAVKSALTVIEAKAVCEGPKRTANVRVAGADGRVFLDLGDDADTVIAVGPDGWAECPDPPVRFVRPAGMLPLPRPTRGGRLADLLALLNLADAGGWVLLLAFLCGCLLPTGPFPMLVILGEQGSGKTTFARLLKKLPDPNEADARTAPRTDQDLMIACRGGWLLFFDNISGLPDWLSDAFCRVATGAAMGTRELYSNDGEVLFRAARPMLLNGITDFIERPDLLERSIPLWLEPISEGQRRPESELWATFDRLHPALLGALLDRVAGGLRELPRVRTDALPRMADFARFALACEQGAGEQPQFVGVYARNQAATSEQALDSGPLPTAVLELMDERFEWTGTPTELLADLNHLAPLPRPHGWPKQANGLTGQLKRLAPPMRKVYGLNIVCGERESGGRSNGKRSRCVTIQRVAAASAAASSPPSPLPPAAGKTPAKTGAESGDGAGAGRGHTGTAAGGRATGRPATVPPVGPRLNNESRQTGTQGDDGDGHSRQAGKGPRKPQVRVANDGRGDGR